MNPLKLIVDIQKSLINLFLSYSILQTERFSNFLPLSTHLARMFRTFFHNDCKFHSIGTRTCNQSSVWNFRVLDVPLLKRLRSACSKHILGIIFGPHAQGIINMSQTLEGLQYPAPYSTGSVHLCRRRETMQPPPKEQPQRQISSSRAFYMHFNVPRLALSIMT